MPANARTIRSHLLKVFPVWARAAADEVSVQLGEAMKFSATRFFFPDCTVPMGGDTYIGNERLEQIHVPLFIDCGTVIDDLLAHEPGSFILPDLSDRVVFPSDWKAATPEQAQGCLWHALLAWFTDFGYRAEFEVSVREKNLEDCVDTPWLACYFAAFSERTNLRFRSRE